MNTKGRNWKDMNIIETREALISTRHVSSKDKVSPKADTLFNKTNSQTPPLVMSKNESVHYFLYDEPSTLAKDCLFYIQLAEENTVHFPWSMELNNLDCYLILYSISGQGNLILNDETYPLRPHTFFFLHCDQAIRLELANSNWTYSALYLNGLSIKKYYHLYMQDGVPTCEDDISAMWNTIRKFYYRNNNQLDIAELLRSQVITELLTSAVVLKYQKTHNAVLIPDYILKMKTILDDRFKENHTLDSLSKELNYNKYKLAKDFKFYTNFSPIDYLIHKRIEESKKLLEATMLSISEIGFKVGIDNTPHFINLFKKQLGITPNKYRIQSGKRELKQ